MSGAEAGSRVGAAAARALLGIAERLQRGEPLARAVEAAGAGTLVLLEGVIWRAMGKVVGDGHRWRPAAPNQVGYYWARGADRCARLVELYVEDGQARRRELAFMWTHPEAARELDLSTLEEWSPAIRFDPPPSEGEA